jgi:hypothetical protein
MTSRIPMSGLREIKPKRNRRAQRRVLTDYDLAKQEAHWRRVQEREARHEEARRKADEEMLAKVDAARADIRAALEQKPKPWWRFW